MTPAIRRIALVLLGIPLVACTPKLELGEFVVTSQESPPQLVVKRADGRVLMTTAGAAIEMRQSLSTWEERFGTFKVEEDAGPWQPVKRLVSKGDGVFDVVFDDAGTEKASLTVKRESEGHLSLALTGAPVNRVRFSFDCGLDDRFLGFGAQADAVDHRGHRIATWMSEPGIGKTDDDEVAEGAEDWFLTGTRHASSYPLPAFLSNRLYAFAADTTRRTVFDLCKENEGAWSVEAWDSAVTLRIFDGPEPAKAIERLTVEIGRQPLANDLALAPWNDAIYGSESVRGVATLLRESKIPSGALWTEDFRGATVQGDNYRLKEEWSIDRTLYPDVEDLAAELHGKGFRWLAYHNTFLVSGTQVLADAKTAGVVVQHPRGGDYSFKGVTFVDTWLVDLTNPAGPDFVKSRLQALVTAGFDGWMADYGEWLPGDAVLSNHADPEAEHNVYSRRYQEVATGALDGHPDKNLATSFSRSGTLRTAPQQPVVWAGDQYTDFSVDDGLPTVVTMGLNLGLGGVSTYGHDIAGYQNSTRPPSTKETFFRWSALGAVSPVMRTHHGTKAKLNWWFGKDADTIEHYRRWSMFHARLWPYLKAAAQVAHDHGLPIMRQLALHFPDDSFVWGIKDAYFFGPSIYVAPVLVEGQVGREVYLPAGSWVSHVTGERFEGPATVTAAAAITEVPMFSPPGTIVPMLPSDFDSLMPAEPPLRDLDDVKGRRSLLVFAGDGSTTDLDGTKYTVSGLGGLPSRVKIGGDQVQGCDVAAEGAPCVAIEAPFKRLTVRGSGLTSVVFESTAGTTTITVDGALQVDSIDYRY